MAPASAAASSADSLALVAGPIGLAGGFQGSLTGRENTRFVCRIHAATGEAMREKVARLAPGDVEGYESFLRMSQAIYKVGFEQLGHVPFDRWADMARVLPDLIKLEGWRTVWQLACKHVRDPKLRMVLTFQSSGAALVMPMAWSNRPHSAIVALS